MEMPRDLSAAGSVRPCRADRLGARRHRGVGGLPPAIWLRLLSGALASVALQPAGRFAGSTRLVERRISRNAWWFRDRPHAVARGALDLASPVTLLTPPPGGHCERLAERGAHREPRDVRSASP